MNKVKNGLLILSLVLVWLSLLLPTGAAADGEGSLLATVTVLPSPLVVTVSAPGSVSVGEHFNVKVTIENRGEAKIKKAVATIDFDPDEGLTLVGGNAEKTIGVIPPHKEKTAHWPVKADQVGTYTIRVLASGEDELTGALLTAEGQTEVEVTAEGQTEVEVTEGSWRGLGHAIWSGILGIPKLLFGG